MCVSLDSSIVLIWFMSIAITSWMVFVLASAPLVRSRMDVGGLELGHSVPDGLVNWIMVSEAGSR